MDKQFLFVYGTLHSKIAAPAHAVIRQNCRFVSNGHMQGKLFEINGYPGAVESGNKDDTVKGEIYQIPDTDHVLNELDEYEECSSRFPLPHEYIRKKLPVILTDGSTMQAWVYIFNHNTLPLRQIKSGDYANDKK